MITPTHLSLEEALKTNSKLHRRCQKAESTIAQNKYYECAFKDGYSAGEAYANKQWEKKLANYKRATRKLIKEGEAIKKLEALLDNGFEPVFDKYGMVLYGEYVPGYTISDQISTAVDTYLTEGGE